jgi:quercetin dioxygenase-like cupin family protein
MIAYIVEGSGTCVQDGQSHGFAADDVVVIPPYTMQQFIGGAQGGFRAWLPQVRLWHVLGLLWQEQFDFKTIPEGTEAIKDSSGELVGFRVPRGILGLAEDLEVRRGADGKREAVIAARRSVEQLSTGNTKYDWFLKRLVEENQVEKKGPRVIKAGHVELERTRQGKLKFYISLWTEVAARALDLMTMEIEPGGHTGKHRHIFEEMIYVHEGKGYDVHEQTKYAWEAGDVVCIPPMTAHQHFNEGDKPARLISTWSRQLAHEFLGGIEHISDASMWTSR